MLLSVPNPLQVLQLQNMTSLRCGRVDLFRSGKMTVSDCLSSILQYTDGFQTGVNSLNDAAESVDNNISVGNTTIIRGILTNIRQIVDKMYTWVPAESSSGENAPSIIEPNSIVSDELKRNLQILKKYVSYLGEQANGLALSPSSSNYHMQYELKCKFKQLEFSCNKCSEILNQSPTVSPALAKAVTVSKNSEQCRLTQDNSDLQTKLAKTTLMLENMGQKYTDTLNKLKIRNCNNHQLVIGIVELRKSIVQLQDEYADGVLGGRLEVIKESARNLEHVFYQPIVNNAKEAHLQIQALELQVNFIKQNQKNLAAEAIAKRAAEAVEAAAKGATDALTRQHKANLLQKTQPKTKLPSARRKFYVQDVVTQS